MHGHSSSLPFIVHGNSSAVLLCTLVYNGCNLMIVSINISCKRKLFLFLVMVKQLLQVAGAAWRREESAEEATVSIVTIVPLSVPL